MPQEWNDINNSSVFRRKKEGNTGPKPVEFEYEPVDEKPDEGSEVRLISAQWEKGSDGYQFNKSAKLNIAVEFLKETFRKKVTCRLFVVYNGSEEDVNHQVDTELNDDGTAVASMKLYYGKEYFDALQDDPKAICSYKAVITHPTASSDLESELLEMPQAESKSLFIRLNIAPEAEESRDDIFRLYSTDDAKTYDKTLTVKDDKKPGDKYLDLEFEEIDDTLSYTLEVDSGAESEKYLVIENTPFKKLTTAA
jgi:hypothetical protein